MNTKLIDELRRHLQQMVMAHQHLFPNVQQRRFHCAEDLLLQHGAVYQPTKSKFTPTPRACFMRAYRLATRRNSRWIYVEGFAVHHDLSIPVHHAWVTRADRPACAYDLAWADTAPAVYLGIPMRADYVRECFEASHRRQYSVIDTWWLSYPLITGAVRIEDVRYTGSG